MMREYTVFNVDQCDGPHDNQSALAGSTVPDGQGVKASYRRRHFMSVRCRVVDPAALKWEKVGSFLLGWVAVVTLATTSPVVSSAQTCTSATRAPCFQGLGTL